MFCQRLVAISRLIVFAVLITLRTVSTCTFSPEITYIQDLEICNDTSLSIHFNVTESCDTVQSLLLHIYHHDSTVSRNMMRRNTSFASNLCGVNATLVNTVTIADFNATSLLQLRLREVGVNGITEICSNNFTLQVHYNGFLGEPININSFSNNCSVIHIIWDPPKINCGKEVLYYNLSIYDDVNDLLVDTVSVNGTSYQFEDTDLFRHRYTYVITGVNELGEGISNNMTFSYQRVPRSAMENTTFDILNYTENNMVNVQYNIPVIIQCTGEAPENATITIECSGSGIVYTNITEVEYAHTPRDITGSVSVPQYEQCSLIVVFSNAVGSSEPFEMTLDTTPPITTSSAISIFDSSFLPSVTVTGSPTIVPVRPPSMTGRIIGIVITFVVIIIIIAVIVIVTTVIFVYCKKKANKRRNINLNVALADAADGYNLIRPSYQPLAHDGQDIKEIHDTSVATVTTRIEEAPTDEPNLDMRNDDVSSVFGYEASTMPLEEKENKMHVIAPGDTNKPKAATRNSVQQISTNDAGTATSQHAHDGDTEGSATQATQATSGDNTRHTVVPSHDPFDIGHGDTPEANAVETKPEGSSMNEPNSPPTLSQEGTNTMQNDSIPPSSDVLKYPIPETSQPPDTNVNNAADISPLTTGQSLEENAVTNTEHSSETRVDTIHNASSQNATTISPTTNVTATEVIGMQATETDDNKDSFVMVSRHDIHRRSSLLPGAFSYSTTTKPNLSPTALEPNIPPTPPEPSLTSTATDSNHPSAPREPNLPVIAPESAPSSTASKLGQVLNDDTSSAVPSVNQSDLEAADSMSPGETGKAPEETGKVPGETGEAPGGTGEAPGETGEAPGETGKAPGETGEAPGEE